MKTVFGTMAFILCFLGAFSQVKEGKVPLGYLTANFSNPSFVNGNLKSFTQTSYHAELVNGEVVKGQKLTDMASASNVSLRNVRFDFNRSGEMIKATGYDENGKSIWHAILDHENGKISKVYFIYNDTLVQYQHHLYDDNGIKEIQAFFPENDAIRSRTIFQTDKNGHHLKSFNYNAAGQLTSEAEFTREEMGRIKTSTLKNSEGIITNQTEYYYSTSHYEPVSMDIKITNGKPADVKGRREHFFDERGNWIRQVRYVNNEPVNITERVYTFYE